MGLEEKKVKTFLPTVFFCNIFADKILLYILTYYLFNFIKKIKIFTEKVVYFLHLVKEYFFPCL